MQSSFLISSTPLVSNKRLGWVIITAVITAGSIVLYSFNPATSNVFPSSPFRELTGLFCAGCGSLRGLHQLLRGNLGAAFGFNPLMVLLLPFMFYSYISYTMEVFTGRSLYKPFIHPKLIWCLVYVIIAYWVLRNIPVEPFSWLAP
ncbi:MAG: DUF2752 domain-containing protein [Rivularia sp. (in: cyanobacteria)]